jgi:radical SAM superfamily enzyme YgiQ (UPF0313 family)
MPSILLYKIFFEDKDSMRVELILPALPSWSVGSGSSVPPLGLLYIAEVLNKENHEVIVTDQQGENLSDENLKRKIKKIDPDIVGFTTYSHSGRKAIKLALDLREINPNLIIIFGGYFASFNAEKILETAPMAVDFCVRGEGEYTALELINALERKQELSEIRGITYRENGIIKSTPDRPIIKDLDALPIPDRTLVKGNKYGEYSNMSIDKFTSISSSRGCPFNCKFCLATQWGRNKWRKRNFRKIADEFEYLIGLGYQNFLFVDDNFTANRKHVILLSQELKHRKFDINWFCEGRTTGGSIEMYSEMRYGGCKMIYLGFESGTQRILDYYNKHTTIDQAVRTVEKIRKAQIDMVTGSFILGAPGETIQELQNTIDFSLKLDIEAPLYGILNVFKGTGIWDEYLAQGYIDPETHWGKALPVCDIHPDCVPRDTIIEIINRGYQKALTRKKWYIKLFLRALKSRFRFKMFRKNISKRHEIAKRFKFSDIVQKDICLDEEN